MLHINCKEYELSWVSTVVQSVFQQGDLMSCVGWTFWTWHNYLCTLTSRRAQPHCRRNQKDSQYQQALLLWWHLRRNLACPDLQKRKGEKARESGKRSICIMSQNSSFSPRMFLVRIFHKIHSINSSCIIALSFYSQSLKINLKWSSLLCQLIGKIFMI